MNKNILILISLVLLLGLGLFYTQPQEQKTKKIQIKKEVLVMPNQGQKKENATSEMRTKKTIKPTIKQKTVSTSPKKQEVSHTHTLLYEPLSIEEAKLSTPPRKHITPIGAIRIKQTMSQLQPNDTLTLSDVEGSDYTLTIQSIYKNNDGSTSTTANYADEGITYTTTITQSEKSSFITLSTANGLYEIETDKETGYIYRTDTIRKQLQSRTPNDVIILPIPKEK